MIDGIQGGSSLARAALEAALSSQRSAAAGIEARVQESLGAGAPTQADFSGSLSETLRAVDRQVRAADELPLSMLRGEISDFHEVAAQVKNAELTFKFALEVRNKLIEAYRETMRMSV
jgi:flagellar hook-basal body complex protein FliE